VGIPSRIGKIVLLAIAGAGLALAWTVLATVLGTASAAHAEERPGAGDESGLASLVGSVTGSLEATRDAALDAVRAAARAIPVRHAASDTVKTASALAGSPVTRPVSGAGTDAGVARLPVKAVQPLPGVVKATTRTGAPLVAHVEGTPLVGGVVASLNPAKILDEASSAVLGAGDAVARLADDTLRTVLCIPVGASWALPDPLPQPAPGMSDSVPGAGRLGSPVPPSAGSPARAPAAVGSAVSVDSWETWWSIATTTTVHAATAATVGAAAAARGLGAVGSIPSPPAATATAGTSSPGPGGAGPGAAAVTAVGLLFAHRAWSRTGRHDSDRAPATPVYATDVSPD